MKYPPFLAPTSKLVRRGPRPMALEPRFMFDGAAVADAGHVVADKPAALFDAPAATAPPVLQAAEAQAQQAVAQFLAQPEARTQMAAMFNGGQAQTSPQWQQAFDNLMASLQDGSAKLPVQLRTDAELQGAHGAYAAQGADGKPVIYLNADWLSSGASTGEVARVLAEETGHAFDRALNGDADTPGDEGELFAATVFGDDASAPGFASDRDTGLLLIDGQLVIAELADPTPSTDGWITLGRAGDPNKGVTDGGWTAAAPDLVGTDGAPYLQYQIDASGKVFFKLRVEAGATGLTAPAANTLIDLDGDGRPEFVVTLSVKEGTGGNSFDGAVDVSGGLVMANTYSYSITFSPLERGSAADANTRPNTTTIAGGLTEQFTVYDSVGALHSVGSAPGTSPRLVDTAGNAYGANLQIYYDTSLDGDADGAQEHYYVFSFNLSAYTAFSSYVRNTLEPSSSSVNYEPAAATWSTTAPFYGATVSATQDNSVNGDIGGGSWTGNETWRQIFGINDAPVAQANSYTVAEDVLLSGRNLITDTDLAAGRDRDPEGSALRITSVNLGGADIAFASLADGTGARAGWKVVQLAHGTAWIKADGSFEYQGAANDSTSDSFSYKVSDGDKASNAATVTLNVTAVNDAPVANADRVDAVASGTASTANGGSAGLNPQGNVITGAITLGTGTGGADTDADGPVVAGTTHTVTQVANAAAGTDVAVSGAADVAGLYGTLHIAADGSYTYTVDNSKTAVQALRQSTNTLAETFRYTLRDAGGAQATCTLTVTVRGSNDAPVAADDYGTAKESLTASLPTGVAAYSAGDPLGSLTTGNVLANDRDTDGYGESRSILGIGATAIGTTQSTTTLNFSAPPNNVKGDYYAFIGTTPLLTSTGQQIQIVTNYVTGSTAIQLTGTIDLARSGLASTISDKDGNGRIDSADLVGETIKFASKADGSGSTGTSTLSAVTATAATTVAITNASGTIAQGMSVSVNGVASGVTVSSVNYDTSGAITSVVMSSAVSLSGATLGFSGGTGQALVGRYGTLTLQADGSYTYRPRADMTELNEGQVGTESFRYTMRDGLGATASANLVILVRGSGTNDPNATPDTSSGSVATAVEAGGVGNQTLGSDATGNLLGNDTTPGGTNVLYSVRTLGSSTETTLSGTTQLVGQYGSLFVNADGSYRYVVNNSDPTVQALRTSSDKVSESFVYTIRNGLTSGTQPAQDSSTLTITILGANDAPVAVRDTGVALAAGVAAGFDAGGNVLANDSDVDDTSLSVVGATGTGTTTASGSTWTVVGRYGTLTLQSNGDYRYTVNANDSAVQALVAGGTTLVDSFSYTVQDNASLTGSLTSAAALDITIRGQNDAPVARDNRYVLAEDSTLSGANIIQDNDSTSGRDADPDAGASLRVGSVNGALFASLADSTDAGHPSAAWKQVVLAHGTLYIQQDGAIAYVPLPDDNAGDRFSYTLVDEAGATSREASVSLDVTPVNDAPVARDNRYSVPADALAGGFNVITNNDYTSGQDGDVDSPLSSLSIAEVNGLSFVANSTDAGHLAADGWMALGLAHGTAWVRADGSMDYRPNDGDHAGDSLTYRISDGAGGTSATATVTFAVQPSVNSLVVNEGSPWAVFTVDGVAGQQVRLELGDGRATMDVDGTPVTDGSEDYGPTLQVFDPVAGQWVAYTGGVTGIPTGGRLLVRTAIINDTLDEGAHEFVLRVTDSEANRVNGTATIDDHGGGDVFKNDGSVDAAAIRDDDRPLGVSSPSVNEGSPYAVFTVTGTAGQLVRLQLNDGTATVDADGIPVLDGSEDYGPTLQVWNGTAWVAYTSGYTSIPASGALLVRTAIVNDTADEGLHDFTLTATNTGGTGATGTATIDDHGGGDVFKEDGSVDAGAPKDDDRSGPGVSSPLVNEGSPYVVFTVTGLAGQPVQLQLHDGTATIDANGIPVTDGSEDYGPALQVWNGSAWVAYTGGFTNIPASGSLMVRTAVINDTADEGAHTFTLTATNLGGLGGTGTATIDDHGGGDVFTDDGSVDSGATRDDDRALAVSSPLVNEASPYAVFTVTGAAGQLVRLQLNDGTATVDADGVPVTDGSEDYGPALQVWNGTAWVAYSGGLVTMPVSGALMVRTATINDTADEGAHSFTLIATNTGGTGATGTATINDRGAGDVFKDDGSVDAGATKDDDRALSVSSPSVNEASPYAVFTVTGASGQRVSLQLNDGTATVDADGVPVTDGSEDYGPALQVWNGTAWVAYGGLVTMPAGGALLVRTAIINDTADEGAHAFTLTATNTGGTGATGMATINDHGAGDVFKDDRSVDAGATKDDDRALSVSSPSVNEASPYAVFTVTGAAGQGVRLQLNDGTATVDADGVPVLDGSEDYGPALQVWNGSAWVAYGGGLVTLPTSGTLLVRTAIVNDTADEGAHAFTLTATNTGGTGATGMATINDHGAGDVFKDDGSVDAGATKDDDRALVVSSPSVNEASPYAVFTVTGASGQRVSLQLNDGTATVDADGVPVTDGSEDYGPALQVWNGSAWVAYSGGQVSIPAGGTLLVRTAIVNDTASEGAHTFTLTATNTGGTGATGTATIDDQGAGDVFKDDGSIDAGALKDDDRPVTVGSFSVNEASPYAVFTVTGAAGQLVRLQLTDGTATHASGSVPATDGSEDYGPNLEAWNGTAWVATTAGSWVRIPNGGTTLLVRTPLVNDTADEGAHAFRLTATTTGGRSASGTATILDHGDGPVLRPDGSVDATATPDDDRAVQATDIEVNEASPFAVFTVRGGAGQRVALSLVDGTAGSSDYGPGIEVSSDHGQTWTTYTTGTVAIGSDGQLLVRTPVVQDSLFEGRESFQLRITPTSGAAVLATAVIRDDGAGPVLRPDGSPDPLARPDDDRPVPATAPPAPAPVSSVPPPAPAPDATPAPTLTTSFDSAIGRLDASPIAPALDARGPLGESLTSDLGFPVVVLDTADTRLSVFNGVTDQFVEGNRQSRFSLPTDAFAHTQRDAVISLSARQADGSPLPDWVRFDPQGGTFTIDPPAGYQGELKLVVIARDGEGREATAPFRLFVGEDKPQSKLPPPARPSFSEQLRQQAGKRLASHARHAVRERA